MASCAFEPRFWLGADCLTVASAEDGTVVAAPATAGMTLAEARTVAAVTRVCANRLLIVSDLEKLGTGTARRRERPCSPCLVASRSGPVPQRWVGPIGERRRFRKLRRQGR